MQKHRVDVPVEEAIRTEIIGLTSYLQCQADERRAKSLFCSGRPMCSLNTWNQSQKQYSQLHKKCFSVAVECMFSTMGLILNGKRSRLSGD